VEVKKKKKKKKLLLHTKTEGDYVILLQEVKKANIAYHTYPLPTEVQPRVALKGIPSHGTSRRNPRRAGTQ
jgi:hypothetical protein